MERLIREFIEEFKKYGGYFTKVEIVILIYNEVKLIYPNVKRSEVRDEVEKYF